MGALSSSENRMPRLGAASEFTLSYCLLNPRGLPHLLAEVLTLYCALSGMRCHGVSRESTETCLGLETAAADSLPQCPHSGWIERKTGRSGRKERGPEEPGNLKAAARAFDSCGTAQKPEEG
eukprot:889359-Rhodomonas_salina.1